MTVYLFIATHPTSGRAIYRDAISPRYSHVRIDAKSGDVLGWTGAPRGVAGERLVECRLATDEELVAYRRALRAKTAARLPQRLERARRDVEMTGANLEQQRRSLLACTLGMRDRCTYEGNGVWRWFAEECLQVDALNRTAAIVRDNVERLELSLERYRKRVAKLEREAARRASVEG